MGFGANYTDRPAASRVTRPDVPLPPSHRRADVQAVQPETLLTVTVEGIDFANFDAAVAPQRWRLPASPAARHMNSGDRLAVETERADASIRQDLYDAA